MYNVHLLIIITLFLGPSVGNPSESSSRSLKLVAKAVQNLANLVEFKSKEPFMTSLNPFIKRHMPDMIKFIDKLSVSNTVYTCTLQNERKQTVT